MPASEYIADRRLYLTRDKSRVVEEGDSSAAWLFAIARQAISEGEMKAYGLDYRDGKVMLPGAKRIESHQESNKAAEKAEDKSMTKDEDKARKRRGFGRGEPE